MDNSFAPAANSLNSTKQISAVNPLLHAWHDPLAGLKTNSHCIKLADLNCDGIHFNTILLNMRSA